MAVLGEVASACNILCRMGILLNMKEKNEQTKSEPASFAPASEKVKLTQIDNSICNANDSNEDRSQTAAPAGAEPVALSSNIPESESNKESKASSNEAILPASLLKTDRTQKTDGKQKADLKEAKHRYRQLPGGVALVFCLIFLSLFSSVIQSYRAWTVNAVAICLEPVVGTDNYMMAQLDYARTLSAVSSPDAEDAFKLIINNLGRICKPTDQRLCYVKLELASYYLRNKQEPLARPIWREQLKFLENPEATAPKQTTSVLQTLADAYNDDFNDKDSALALYLATLRFWSHSPGLTTISNIRSNIAEIYIRDGNYPKANEYFRLAYDYSKQWKKQFFNVYRLWQIGYTYNEMGMYSDALPYLQEANEMAPVAQWPQGDALENLQRELNVAKQGSRAAKDALHGTYMPSRYFDDLQYKLSRDVHTLWTEGRRLEQIGKYNEAVNLLERANRLGQQVGWPTGDELQSLQRDLQFSRNAAQKTGK